MNKKIAISLVTIFAVIGVLLVVGTIRNQGVVHDENEDVAAFFKGQIITWIIPYAPGGGYDEYARLLSPYLRKYTGARVDVENLPGAGGMKGVNELYIAPNDGLVIGMINGSALVTSELAGVKGANYELDKFAYLGRIVADPRVLVMSKAAGFNTFADIVKSPAPVKIGATGLGGSTYVDAVITKEAFKMNVEIIHGFDSSSVVRQEMLRGNIKGTWGSYGSAEEGIDGGAEIVMLQSGSKRMDALPDVPAVFEFADITDNPQRTREILKAWDALIAVGRSVAAPPGTPENRLAFLRDAFDKAMHDPELIALGLRTGRLFDYASGAEIHEITNNATNMPPDIKDLFVKAINGQL